MVLKKGVGPKRFFLSRVGWLSVDDSFVGELINYPDQALMVRLKEGSLKCVSGKTMPWVFDHRSNSPQFLLWLIWPLFDLK
jgi:hypothetical protein